MRIRGRGASTRPLSNRAGSDADSSFRVCELEHIAVLESGRALGLRPLMFVHSHPDGVSELSSRDHREFKLDDLVLFPHLIQLVVSILHGHRCAMSASIS